MPYRNPNFSCEPAFDNSGTCRIKVTCPQCHATYVGNADQVIKWQKEHLCAKATRRA